MLFNVKVLVSVMTFFRALGFNISYLFEREIGILANKTGAACCKVLGGLPNDQSR